MSTRNADELLSKVPPQMRTSELKDMVRAIAARRMGPGRGWYKPGQSRFSWAWLQTRLDTNKDGEIAPTEFSGPEGYFRRFDRDGSGTITKDDFDWTDESPYMQQVAQTEHLFRRLDLNSDGRLDRDEWMAAFERLGRNPEGASSDDVRKLLFPDDQLRERPSPEVLLAGLISGEIGSHQLGPSVGDRAPEFELHTHDGKQIVRLSQFRGRKPVVLIFGSFT
jgi:hypothetical protein